MEWVKCVYPIEGKNLGNARNIVQEHFGDCSSCLVFSRIYWPQLSTSHAGPEMTLKPNKHCCSAQVLHGCNKCIGPAGTWHSAPANKPSQNCRTRGCSTKPYWNLCALVLTSFGYAQIEHENWGILQHVVHCGHNSRIYILIYLSWFCIKLAQLYSQSG